MLLFTFLEVEKVIEWIGYLKQQSHLANNENETIL